MADDNKYPSPDKVAKVTFVSTLIGCVLFGLVVILFIL